MANIIFLNGAPGIGKSTTAGELHKALPLSYLWEKDAQRRKFSDYKKTAAHYSRSRELIRSMGNAIIQWCIRSNTNLIYDGVLWKKSDILSVEETVQANGGNLLHILLTAPKEVWKQRLLERGISGSLAFDKAEKMYDSLDNLKHQGNMKEIATSSLKVHNVCEKIELMMNP